LQSVSHECCRQHLIVLCCRLPLATALGEGNFEVDNREAFGERQ
jgi:hypothetical protein